MTWNISMWIRWRYYVLDVLMHLTKCPQMHKETQKYVEYLHKMCVLEGRKQLGFEINWLILPLIYRAENAFMIFQRSTTVPSCGYNQTIYLFLYFSNVFILTHFIQKKNLKCHLMPHRVINYFNRYRDWIPSMADDRSQQSAGKAGCYTNSTRQ